MKKKILIFLIISGVIQAILWSFDILRFYNYPTVANEPNLKQDSKFVWSKLAKPERLDFICFKAKDNYLGEFEAAMRLVGMPNDVLEIKNGDLYVNDVFIDENLDLRRLYKCDKSYFHENLEPLFGGYHDLYFPFQEDSIAIYLNKSFYESSKFQLERFIQPKNKVDRSIQQTYQRDWNIDNFGPLKILDDMYFVLGDNRENAMDSRYLGFISKNDILGTVIYKFN